MTDMTEKDYRKGNDVTCMDMMGSVYLAYADGRGRGKTTRNNPPVYGIGDSCPYWSGKHPSSCSGTLPQGGNCSRYIDGNCGLKGLGNSPEQDKKKGLTI